MRKRPLFYIACVFLTGLAFQRYKSILLLFLLIGVLSVEVFYGIKHGNRKQIAGRSMVLLSAFLIAMVHMQSEIAFRDAYMSKIIDNSTVVVWGEIKTIKTTDSGIRMILTDAYIHLKEEIVPCNDIMVYASSNHFQVGEIHKITGQFQKFETARNQGQFDSQKFYQSQKIDFIVWLEESCLLNQAGNGFASMLLSVRDVLNKSLFACMKPKVAGFFSGMLLGDKSNLEDALKELFELGGISHILAISGLHVSIIGRGFYQLLRKRGVGFGLSGVIAGMVLLSYCYMVGNGMSAVRAVAMMLLFFFGQFVGRTYDMLNALGAVCLILLWDNPFLLEYTGFWFSVMALIGVGYVGKDFSEQSKKGKSFWMSVGITITTLPIVAYSYYEIPLYSPLVNMLVLPILTPIFCLALLGAVLGVFLPQVAVWILLPCSWTLGVYEWICRVVEYLPFAKILTGKPKVEMIVLYYIILFIGAFVIGKRKNVFWCRVILAGICFLCMIYPKPYSQEISFLDVGQGDGIYISAGDGTTYFIDGGSTSEKMLGEYTLLPFLKAKGIRTIDYWFVTHSDEDHVSGLIEVLESGYEVRHLVLSAFVPRDEAYEKLISFTKTNGTEVIYMNANDQIISKDVRFICLYPWDASKVDRNDASLVLEVEFEMKDGSIRRAIFAGDISTEIEKELVEKGVLEPVWLYKASHHGSKYSNSKELLQVLQPEITVISCAKKNSYGHPHEEAIERIEEVGSEVFYTMENGQVSVNRMMKK